MASLLPTTKLMFLGNDGKPLVGGKIYTYDTGTNTPKATYADAAGSISLSNPIILDSRGEALVFWSGSYRVKLNDALDNNIWTADSISEIVLSYRTGSNGSIISPYGTTAQRDIIPQIGYFRFNTDINQFEGFNGSVWAVLQGANVPNNTNISTLNALIGINNGQIAGLRNRIINGGCLVSERYQVLLSIAYQYGSCDRHMAAVVGGSAISATLRTFTTFGGVSRNLSYGGYGDWTNGVFAFQHRIEAANVADLNGKTVTFSCKVFQNTGASRNFRLNIVKPTVLDNHAVQSLITNSGVYTVPSGVFTLISFTFTLGSTDATNGLAVAVFDDAPNTVIAKTYAMGEIQLELGSIATVFEERLYGTELALCQRYHNYVGYGFNFMGYASSTTNSNVAVSYPQMRTTPNLSLFSTVGSGILNTRTLNSAAPASVSNGGLGLRGGNLQITTTAGNPTLAAGDVVMYQVGNSALYFDAEIL